MEFTTGVAVAVVALTASTVLGLMWRRRDGRFRETAAPVQAGPDPLLVSLGVDPGAPLTLLQFSSAFCGPCRTTRVLCAEVAATVPGVHHLEVDAESQLDAVRALEIWRTPTVLLVDGQGRIRQRASGAPTRAQLLAAVAQAMAPVGEHAPDTP